MTTSVERRRAYGVSDVAHTAGLAPSVISGAAESGARGVPEPDYWLDPENRHRPVWLAETIEPWIAAQLLEQELREGEAA